MKISKHYCDLCGTEQIEGTGGFQGKVDIKYSTGGNGRNVITKDEICLDCCTKIADTINKIIDTNRKP